jgi:hypothetical protein
MKKATKAAMKKAPKAAMKKATKVKKDSKAAKKEKKTKKGEHGESATAGTPSRKRPAAAPTRFSTRLGAVQRGALITTARHVSCPVFDPLLAQARLSERAV